MNQLLRHISRSIALCAAVTLMSGLRADAQELLFPSSWTSPWEMPDQLFRKDTVSLCFMGDIMMHTRQIETAEEDGNYGFDSYFTHIKDKIEAADLAVGNVEFSLAGKPYTGYPSFSAPDSYAYYIAECGFDIFLTANNHVFDKGAAGAERTMEIYRSMSESHGIRFTGTASDQEERDQNHPLIVNVKGIRIAFVNFSYGSNLSTGRQWPKMNMMREREDIMKAIRKAQEAEVDYIIILPHWGSEYILKHSEAQGNMARWLTDAGADAIIGAHPHVIQDYEEIDGVPVVYSMGNAVSNMSAANTQLELLVEMKIVRESNGDLRMLPLEFTYLWCSLPDGYSDSYTVLPVRKFIDRKKEWNNPADYEKMISTYNRVMKATGVPEGSADIFKETR